MVKVVSLGEEEYIVMVLGWGKMEIGMVVVVVEEG